MKKTHRKLAREKAVFGIYQWRLINASLEELEFFLSSDKMMYMDAEARIYALDLISKVMENYAGYRLEISRYLKKGWTFERLSYLEQAILLVALAELKNTDLGKEIIINEAVEMAKQYADSSSHRFINGILKNIETSCKSDI